MSEVRQVESKILSMI